MNGLQAVAHVGESAADDDAHGVVEVRPLHLDLEADGLDPTADVASGDGRRIDRLAEVGRCVGIEVVRVGVFAERFADQVVGVDVVVICHGFPLLDA